jgi:hypothetical protein
MVGEGNPTAPNDTAWNFRDHLGIDRPLLPFNPPPIFPPNYIGQELAGDNTMQAGGMWCATMMGNWLTKVREAKGRGMRRLGRISSMLVITVLTISGWPSVSLDEARKAEGDVREALLELLKMMGER